MKGYVKEEMILNKNLFIDLQGVKDKRFHTNSGEPDPQQVKTCEAWIKLHCSHQKTVNHKRSSYGLKHTVEHWGRDINKLFDTEVASPYVTSGAFIQAAHNCRFYPVIFRNRDGRKEKLWNPYFRIKIDFKDNGAV